MIGKISSADHRVNFGSGIKPAAQYKEGFASVIYPELKKASGIPASEKVNLLRAWEKLLQWEQKPFEFDLLTEFKNALNKGHWLRDDNVETTFFTRQDYTIRQDVKDEVEQALLKDNTLYITGLITATGKNSYVIGNDIITQLSIPVNYANNRTINFTPEVHTEDKIPLLAGKYMVFNPQIVEGYTEEFHNAIQTDLMNESLQRTADELWEKYGTEINEAAAKFEASAQNNGTAVE